MCAGWARHRGRLYVGHPGVWWWWSGEAAIRSVAVDLNGAAAGGDVVDFETHAREEREEEGQA